MPEIWRSGVYQAGWQADAGACGLCVGRRGFVVEVDRYAIAQCKLGYSMGLILEARGICIKASRFGGAAWFLLVFLSTFYTLGFRAKPFLSKGSNEDTIGARRPLRASQVHMMKTYIRVKH